MKMYVIVLGIIVLIITIGLTGCFEESEDDNSEFLNQLTEKVDFSTDKTEYDQGKIVKLALKGTHDETIFYLAEFLYCDSKPYKVYRFSDEKQIWMNVTLPPSKCATVVSAGAPIYKKLNPNESVEFMWDQKIRAASEDAMQAPAGRYRISLKCKNSNETEEIKEVYSNNFTINSLERIIVTTDKIEYQVGENISIRIENKFDESVTVGVENGCEGRVYIISKHDEGKWIDFPETCGACDVEISTSVKGGQAIVFSWNQTVYTNHENCILKNVSSGIYRIKIKGNFITSNSNSFTIKE